MPDSLAHAAAEVQHNLVQSVRAHTSPHTHARAAALVQQTSQPRTHTHTPSLSQSPHRSTGPTLTPYPLLQQHGVQPQQQRTSSTACAVWLLCFIVPGEQPQSYMTHANDIVYDHEQSRWQQGVCNAVAAARLWTGAAATAAADAALSRAAGLRVCTPAEKAAAAGGAAAVADFADAVCLHS